MDRRSFIKNAGLAALVPTLSPMSFKMPATFNMGYQLFSVRDALAKDAVPTLAKLKAMGYQHFEAYGYDDVANKFYGHPAGELQLILEDLGLEMTSGHYNFTAYLDESADGRRRYVDRCIVGATALNSKYITWPWISPEQRTLENFKKMVGQLNEIGEQVTSAGLGFAYHNHGFEFEDHDGENGFDIITGRTDPNLVKLQMDMYWVMHAGMRTPKDIVAAHPGRVTMWHIKDMHKLSRDYTELGNGSLDYNDLLPDPEESGLEYHYLEQGGNYTHDSMTSAADSAGYFKEHLHGRFR